MKRVLVSLSFLFVAACNNIGVGSPCTVTTDCEIGLVCNTSVPGGMCTHGCSFEGATRLECPAGSVCAAIGTNSLNCVPSCTGAGQCRDQYECNQTAKACKPKS